MEKENIINTAIKNLNKTTGIKAKWKGAVKATAKGIPDGVLTFDLNNKKLIFDVEVKVEMRFHNVIEIIHQNLLNQKRIGRPLLIVATKIYPKVKEFLRENKTAYLETNGNVYIEQEDIIIRIDGQKPIQETKTKPNRAFTKTGVKLLFLFLTDEEWLNRPYREVANMAGVALGAIPVTRNALKELGFVVKIEEKRFMLANKEELLKRWITAYGEKLKPGIRLGRFLLDENTIKYWKEIPFQVEDTLWGGEPAADVLTNYLKPERFTLYTKLKTADLIKKYRLIPHENGQVEIFDKFWKLDKETWNTAPPLIVYADLINTDDSRNIEVANIIYEEYLKNI